MVNRLCTPLVALLLFFGGAVFDAASAMSLVPFEFSTPPLVVTSNGVWGPIPAPTITNTAVTADGSGGAFVNGVEALVLDGSTVDLGVSALASESVLASAAASVAPAALFAAAAFAGLDLAAQGLANQGGQVVSTSSGMFDSMACANGSQAYFIENSGTVYDIGGVEAYFQATGTYMVNPQVVAFTGTPQGTFTAQYTCSDGSNATPSSAPVVANPSSISSAVSRALSANPSAAPRFATALGQDGVPIPVVPQAPTGPQTVSLPPTTTTSVASPPAGSPAGTAPTTTTNTCTPSAKIAYTSSSVSVAESTTCTTTTTGPAGTASSATTTTAPVRNASAASSVSQPFIPPSVSFPSSSSPTGTVALPTVSVPASSGTCPAPITFVVFGVTYSISLTPLCTLAGEIQPFVIGINGLAAALFILRGV